MPWRRLFGDRTVRRQVRGVDMYMPWSHVLPDFTDAGLTYGQNLVELAAALAGRIDSQQGLQFVDIGANIGDSALQVLQHVDGHALCIEGDEYWARYLRMNVAEDPRITIEEVMLGTPEVAATSFTPFRRWGTTTFQPGDEAPAARPMTSIAEVRARQPEFADVRLIKSDTDGFDPLLVPEAARAWAECGPVLFFEYDPALARRVANCEPRRLWDDLAALGYSRLAIWDNAGDPLGQLDLTDAAAAAAILDSPPPDLGYSFWDVAVRRGDDANAAAAFDEVLGFGIDRRAIPRTA